MSQKSNMNTYSFLPLKTLSELLQNTYNIENAEITEIKFKDTVKQRAVYKVTYGKECYCLKKVYFNDSELLFVYSAIEWLYRNGLNVPNILPTNNRGRFAKYNDMLFILTPWIEGTKCDFDDINHILLSVENLAKMHDYSKNFVPITGSASRNSNNDFLNSINKHFMHLLTSSNCAFKHMDRFSKKFLNHFDTNLKLAKISLETASNINYNNISIGLCHMDYVNKNIILDSANNVWVIDFDKCKIDYSVQDLAYFLRRLLTRNTTNWNFIDAMTVIEMYDKITPLSDDEFSYLISYLAFPQKFWKISRDYYNNHGKCNKTSFVTILNKAVEKEISQTNFILNMIDYRNKKKKF